MFNLFLKELLLGKGVSRILFNILLQDKMCYGKVLDIGGGHKINPSHMRFLKFAPGFEIQSVNISEKAQPDYLIDLETGALPVADNFYDFVLAFNFFEHILNIDKVALEFFRVLKKDGELIGFVPFLANVHPDPHDYCRYTKEKLIFMFKDHEFEKIEILSVGRGPFVAAYRQIEFVLPIFLRIFVVSICFCLDWFLRKIKPKFNFTDMCPLGYLFYVKK